MTGKYKNIILIVAVFCLGLLLVGGTYAFLTFSANVTNATYNVTSTCFDIDFETGEAITGTLVQSSTPHGGLSGVVRMNIKEECRTSGRGTLTLDVASEEGSSILLSEGALKYAVYEDETEEPVAAGVIDTNGEIDLYDNFVLPRTFYKEYYIYIWLDGTIADNSYANIPFSASIKASATQSNDCVMTFAYQDSDIDYLVWTQLVNAGESFPLIRYPGTFLVSCMDMDTTEVYYNSEDVTVSCGTAFLCSNDFM